MKHFTTLLQREILLQARQKTEWAPLLLFFVIVIILMPFALGPDQEILSKLAPGLIWLAALLMSLLSLDRLFMQDARDGTLDEMLVAPMALELIVTAKILAQIFVMIAVLLVMVFPAALLLGMNFEQVPVLVLTFMLGIPALALLGGVAGAVTIALNRNAALMTLLLIPFYIPILIFAVSACDAMAGGGNIQQPLLFLTAFLTLISPTAPYIIAAALRQGQG
jgi:heme exporter protein B